MTRRTQRVGNLIRNTVGPLLLTKLSDPRIDPSRTSITRVEVPEDLLTAKVFVSVIGSEKEQRNTIRGLEHAAGHLQELMMQQIHLRRTPLLEFVLDLNFKKTLQTLSLIRQAMDEIEDKERSGTVADEVVREQDSSDEQ